MLFWLIYVHGETAAVLHSPICQFATYAALEKVKVYTAANHRRARARTFYGKLLLGYSCVIFGYKASAACLLLYTVNLKKIKVVKHFTFGFILSSRRRRHIFPHPAYMSRFSCNVSTYHPGGFSPCFFFSLHDRSELMTARSGFMSSYAISVKISFIRKLL